MSRAQAESAGDAPEENILNFNNKFFSRRKPNSAMSSRNSDGLGSRQHSDSYSLSQRDVHGDADDLENCEQEPHDIFGKKKRARAEERTFDEVDRWEIYPEILSHIRKFLDD